MSNRRFTYTRVVLYNQTTDNLLIELKGYSIFDTFINDGIPGSN